MNRGPALATDNRDLSALAESQIDEIRVLRGEVRRLKKLAADKDDEIEILRGIVYERDSQLSGF